MKRKMDKKSRSNGRMFIFFFVAVVCIVVIFLSRSPYPDNKNCNEIVNEDCDDVFLGICFDNNSQFYKCNIKEDKCDIKDWNSASTIRFMLENGIIIYGNSNCGWCKMQLSQFGFVESLVKENKNLYIDCANSKNRKVCADVKSTPTWKKNGKIIYQGYIDIEAIKDLLSKEIK